MSLDKVSFDNVEDVLVALVDSIPSVPNSNPLNAIVVSSRDHHMLEAALQYIQANKKDFKNFIDSQNVPNDHPWIKHLGYTKKEVAIINNFGFLDKED